MSLFLPIQVDYAIWSHIFNYCPKEISLLEKLTDYICLVMMQTTYVKLIILVLLVTCLLSTLIWFMLQ